MQWTMQRDELLAGLTMIKGSVDKQSGIPVMQNILCESYVGGITITANNLGHGMKIPLAADIIVEGAITIPAQKLLDICTWLPSGTITFQVSPEHWITLRSAGFTSRLAGLPKEDFPDFITTMDGCMITLQAEDLHMMIAQTSYAICRDESRPVLGSIELQILPQTITMTATDGHRLATTTIPCDQAETATILIAASAAVEIKKLCANHTGTVDLHFNQKQMLLVVDAMTFAARLCEGTFPAWQQVIPTAMPIQISMATDQLMSVVRRVALMCNDTRTIKCVFLPQTLQVTATNAACGEASETVSIDYEGEELVIGVNASYLLDSLFAMSSETIWLHLDSPSQPLLLHPAQQPAGQTRTHIIMPKKLV